MSSSTNPQELGVLVVVVLKARNLPDKHTFTKQDPFAAVQLGPFKGQTQVDKRGGQHPVWDEDLHLKVPSSKTKENRTLKVSCYSKEPKGDDLIGAGEIDITETLKAGEFDDWVKLETNGAYRGEVYLEMTFFAAGPPPLVRRPSKMAPSERLWRPLQTPPRTPAQGSPHVSPPARYTAELSTGTSAPSSPRPRPNHLLPPRASRSQSPSSRTDAPLPPLPEEIPASLRPAPLRAPASGSAGGTGKAGNAGTSPKSDPVPIPAALRPGAPGARPASYPQKAQHQGSLPTSPTRASQLPAPGVPAYKSPLDDHGSGRPVSPPVQVQPVTVSPRNDHTGLPPVSPTHQPVYGTSWPGNEYAASHSSVPASGPPGYPASHPPVSPYGHVQGTHPPSSAPNQAQAAYPPHTPIHQSTYPSYVPPVSPTSYPPINPTYDPPPLSAYASSPPPATSPAIPVHSPGSLHLSFPEPSITPAPPPLSGNSGYYPTPAPSSGSYLSHPNETEEERQRRLSTRYGSPMPLPPGATAPPPLPKPSQGPPAKSPCPSPSPNSPDTSPKPTPSVANMKPDIPSLPKSPTSSSASAPVLASAPSLPVQPAAPTAPSWTPIPPSYIERERLALERLKQEEADAEMARQLAAEAEAEAEAEERARRERREKDEEEARRLVAEAEAEREREKERGEKDEQEARALALAEEERERERQKAVEETDEELARRLAREWNSDVLEEVRRRSRDSGATTGASAGPSRMPGGW